ncbi:MAG: cbb3-type cytochrome c oxidase subunit 3, partial [Thiotrichales bacterium]
RPEIEMIGDAWIWITQLANSKIVALLIFFTLFVGILLYVFTNRQRGERLESYKYMPFQDEPSESEQEQGKGK